MRCLDFGTISQDIEPPSFMDQLRICQKFGWLLLLRHMKPCKRLSPPKKSQLWQDQFFFEFILFLTTGTAGNALNLKPPEVEIKLLQKTSSEGTAEKPPLLLGAAKWEQLCRLWSSKKNDTFFDSEGRGWIKGYKILELGTLGLLAKVGS